MRRTIFTDEHQALRETFGSYLDREVAPVYDDWERAGLIPREVLRQWGRLGFLGPAVPAEHGGAGADDFRFNTVLLEEAAHRGFIGVEMALSVHSDVALPYVLELGTPEQKERWLPGLANGDLIAGIAMTEPSTGSDVAGIGTRARKSDGGYVVSGAKTFISNGINADVIVTAVRTGTSGRPSDISLVMIEDGMPGFSRGRNLDKLGSHSQDTAELFFDEVPVPRENLLGEEGRGFAYLMQNLAQERLAIAVASIAAARGALARTLDYVKERTAFGRPVGTFQNSRFKLAACHGEAQVTTAHVDAAIDAHVRGELSAEDAAVAKWWATEAQGRIIDACLQLHGGYGYMMEYPIARSYADARIKRILGGTSEIMLELVGRSLGLAEPRP
ncbi:MAG TPA: acyl-CoA dehydrogenase family protein [Baekduia sp.]|uniref:acyl-CoA dehydrogenase family protein n=1 Tax=Baekduia sp. TaxID=2600305 RepID=UPI002D76C0BD|nr:acyl-CoA dehydrogenase family protein [Baekduia sp.]HET6507892.1 acyl-CoA dehydrogenase family protein [Baekduia sp.]